MIKSLGEHGVLASDLAPSLVTTQKIENPDYDPLAAQEKDNEERTAREATQNTKLASTIERSMLDRNFNTHDRCMEEQTDVSAPQTSASPSMPQRPLPAANGQLGQDLPNDEDDGNIGAPPESRRSVQETEQSVRVEQRHEQAQPLSGEIAKVDITTLTEDSPKSSTAKGQGSLKTFGVNSKPERSPSEQPGAHTSTSDESKLIHFDPNTAAQTAAAEANVAAGPTQDNISRNFGLTANPQAVEPPPNALPGVTAELSTTDTHITLDLRWTILCDLFLVLTADSVYDARSRVLLEKVAEQLGLSWMDVTKFEKRVTDALEIEEGVEKLKDKTAITRREKEAQRKKWAMVGLATVGGGLVIGLSAGLAAPLVGVGLAGLLGGVGVGGTSAFLSGVGGAVLITTTGTAAGAALGGRGMSRRTQSVKTFMFQPIHNNKRINCIITVPGFMSGEQDDVRLPFSVIDSIMGDVFSVLWEPEMMREMGNAINILWNETIVMGVQQVLAATIAGGLLGALAWPLWLTKLGYLIDNPWSNALTRAEAAGKILADILFRRQLGVRPITLVGFSLGARVIFYALCELAKKNAYGVVQNVFIFGAPVTASDKTWREARSVVAGRFVNGFSSTDWILGYLFRATSGGLRSIAGLHAVERVPDVENVDVTTSVPGHLQYRAFMPLVLSEVGFRVTQDWFDEPEDLSKITNREVVLHELEEKKCKMELKTVKTSSGGFGKIWRRKTDEAGTNGSSGDISDDPSRTRVPAVLATESSPNDVDPANKRGEDDDLPPREKDVKTHSSKNPESWNASQNVSIIGVTPPGVSADDLVSQSSEAIERAVPPEIEKLPSQSVYVDTEKMLAELRDSGIEVKELQSSLPALSLSDTAAGENSQGRPATDSLARSPAITSLCRASAAPSRSSSKPGIKASVSSFFSRKTVIPSVIQAPSSPLESSSPARPTIQPPLGASADQTQDFSAEAASQTRRSSSASASQPGDSRDSHLSTPALASPAEISGSWYDRSGAPADSAVQQSSQQPSPRYTDVDQPDRTVNLSFTSNFDEKTHECKAAAAAESPAVSPVQESVEASRDDVADKAKTYGLTTEAAKELAMQFRARFLATGGSNASFGRSAVNPFNEDSGDVGWGTSDTVAGPTEARSRDGAGVVGVTWAELSSFPSMPSSASARTLRPFETSYGSLARAAAGSDEFAAIIGNGRGGSGLSRTPRLSSGRGMNFEEATENPWG